MSAIEELGFVVIEVFSPNQINDISQEFLRIAINAPELNPNITHNRFVMGGVGYCPFASVAYHPLIRHINRSVYQKALPVFLPLLQKDETLLLSMLPDRPLVRFPIQTVDEKGKWHQDDAANALDNDNCYGGWINLNFNETQYFKAIPGTHKPDHPIFQHLDQKNGGRRGFADFKSKKDFEFLENYWKTNIGKKNLIPIPPGHLLIFRETLIHTVFKNPKTNNCILRLHTSFNISPNPIPLHDRNIEKKYAREPIREYFRKQHVVPVRSGQETPVYSPMNLYPKNKPQVEELSTHYIDLCKDNHTGLVLRFLPSMSVLEEFSKGEIPMHPPMTDDEIALFIPHRP